MADRVLGQGIVNNRKVMMIDQLELKNFTSFGDLDIDFSSKINVIIGENGTGKTHLLKAAYGLCAGASLFKNRSDLGKAELEAALTAKFLRLFMPLDDKLGKMHLHGAREQASLTAQFAEGQKVNATFFNNSTELSIKDSQSYAKYRAEPVFIPTKEVLSLVKGMADETHDQKTVELIFDDGYVDLAKALTKASGEDLDARINEDPRLNSIIPQLVSLVGGCYQWENGGFCFQPGEYREKPSPKRTNSKSAQAYQDSTVTEFVAESGRQYSSSMTAEGFRKIGILHRLLSNGVLSPGSSGPLFWDEPESNMNPKLMKLLVQVLLELARNNQQVILATHDYVLLKWFDLLARPGQGDHIRFHALVNKGGQVTLQSANSYKELDNNAIANTFNDLYDEEIKRSLGGKA
ncbi:AAA family ATPase [Tamilnaduibacter salinus]|uniref:AAA family ATPase n=1 Tax=Tamilnaduibacter salinus TaxID=1484056 RepID=UPI001A9C7C5B|nr:ATP-binding protein [Tamilnaduibacter salinus]